MPIVARDPMRCEECGDEKRKCLCGHWGCDCIDRHPCLFEDDTDTYEYD